MAFAKDLFDGVQAKMVTSIDEYERLEVGALVCVWCTCGYMSQVVHRNLQICRVVFCGFPSADVHELSTDNCRVAVEHW